MKKNKQKELAYYLTTFKIQGHETWRAHLGSTVSSFSEQLKSNSLNHPKVTAKKVHRIDRITGLMEEL